MESPLLSPPRLLVALMATLSLSLVYPQAAYPVTGSALGAVIGAIAILAVMRWKTESPNEGPLLTSIALAFAAAWSAWWLVLWCFRSEVPVLGTFATATVLQSGCAFVAFVALVSLQPRDRGVHFLLSGWIVVSAVLIALHAIYQIIGPAGLPGTFATRIALIEANPEVLTGPMREGILHSMREARASGLFGSPNILAGFLAMAFPLTIACSFERSERWSRLGFAVAALVLLLGIVMTGSRGGLLGAAVGLGVVGGLLLPRLLTRASVAACFLLVTIGAVSSQPIVDRWTGTSTIQQRLYYWESGVEIWRKSPLIGVGPGGFELHYPMTRHPRANETRFAHNWFVQWASETGVIGVVLFLGWIGAVLAAGFARWRTNSLRNAITAGLLAAFIVLIIHGLVEFTLSIREITLHMAIIAALLVADQSRSTSNRAKHFGLISAAACVALLVSSWWFVQFAPARATALRELVGYESPADDATFLSRAIQWQPRDATLWEARGFARYSAGIPGIQGDLEQALKLNPFSSRLHESLGRVRWASGDREAAMTLQRDAMRLHPADPDRRVQMAEYLLEEGDTAGALQLLESTEELLWTRTEGRSRRDELMVLIGASNGQRDEVPEESQPPVQ